MISKVLLVMLSIAVSVNASSQEVGREIKSQIKEANVLFEETEYAMAYSIYRRLDSLEPNNAVYKYRIGVYFALSHGEKTDAIPYLEFALKNMPSNEFPYSGDYYLGMSYHFNLQFEKAIEHLKKYKEIIKNDQYQSIKINRLIQNCENGIELVKSPVDVAIRNMGSEINSKYTDHSPFISADEGTLIFTSRREGSTGGILNDDGQYMEDIYISKAIERKWNSPKNVNGVNSKEMDACVGLSVDGQKMFIYKAGKGGSDIYISEQDGDTWSEPEKLNDKINTPKYNENSASLSADGSKLYFSSDRPGGYGGFDIYSSKLLVTGAWDVARNLGPKVNSKYDEDSPFIHPDGKTLYYSSNGFNSMGGNDIFFAKLESDRWGDPQNIGHPINTPGNDNTIVISASNKHAYFTAEREGGYGGNDIYVATLPEISSDALTLVKGIITDRGSGKPIKASIKVYDKVTKHRINYVYAPNPETGKYMMIFSPGKNYDMVIEAEGYSNYLINIYIPDQKHFYELTQEISLSKLDLANGEGAGEEITIKSTIIDYIGEEEEGEEGSGFQVDLKTEDEYADLIGMLEQIIFNTDSMALENLNDEVENLDNPSGKSSEAEEPNYDFLLNMISDVIETTDSLALENLDKKLETEVSTEKYLYADIDTTSQGVTHGGNSVQVLGKVDVNEEKKKFAEEREKTEALKRAEERKVEQVRINSLIMDTEGLDDDDKMVVSPALVEEKVEETPIVQDVVEVVKEEVPVKEKIDETHLVQFIYSSFEPSLDSKKDLQKLMKRLIADTKIQIELHGHADGKGEEDYNLKLSKKRTQSVANYLKTRNISSS
ncbi:MAG: PD40 domain-containing protein, partial [Flavobacteriales bacterium]|nr:PD40 domain-containing protein [Flavobacteriales bacterium]